MNPNPQNFITRLESIKKMMGDLEYWSARELMPILGYSTWAKFIETIERAKKSFKTTEGSMGDHFAGAGKMVAIGSKSSREVQDFFLTRYACYLIALNGDFRKPEIAFAQKYFATQTRKQELLQQEIEDKKRIVSRKKLEDREKKIRGTVYTRGISRSVEFASFKDHHIQGLYGGITTKELKQKRNIPDKRPLADFDSDVELRAKDFALSMADHNIKTKNMYGREKLNREALESSKATRKALLSRGIVPEQLKPRDDIKKISRKYITKKRLKKLL